MAVELCDRCRLNDFETLRYPTIADLELARFGRPPLNQFPFKSHADRQHTHISLGTLTDVISRRDCRLCQAIWKELGSRDIYTPNGRARNGAEVAVLSSISSHWGLFRYPKVDSGKDCTLFRLSITTHVEPDHGLTDQAHIYIDNLFQPCNGASNDAPNAETLTSVTNDSSPMVFGGRRRPLQIEIDWLKSWLSICEHEHGDVCKPLTAHDSADKLEHIRFIDVQRRCIVKFEHVVLASIPYVALSYVWGQASSQGSSAVDYALTSQTRAQLELDGGLAAENLPQTIQDTLALTQKLGLQYAWVDRLCIIQDDVNDKASQIARMHAIYSAAYVTVIAASGQDANSGLRGLREGTRLREQESFAVIPPCEIKCPTESQHDCRGMSLITSTRCHLPAEPLLRDTRWNTRAWVLQERALSRRSLVFLDESVYFACSSAIYFEDSYCEVSFPYFQHFSARAAELQLRSVVPTFAQALNNQERFWQKFCTFVRRYSQRTLSYQGDGLDAISAILRAMTIESEGHRSFGEPIDFLWGLPLPFFETSLSWTTMSGQSRRKGLTTLPMAPLNVPVPFPSWSWLGWIGEVDLQLGEEKFESERSTVEVYCHKLDPSSLVIEPLRSDIVTHGYLQQPMSSWNAYEDRDVTMEMILNHTELTESRLRLVCPKHILFFWTSFARFKLEPVIKRDSPVQLIDNDLGINCITCLTVEQHLEVAPEPEPGVLESRVPAQPQIIDSQGLPVGNTCRMTAEHFQEGGYDHGVHEFIVIGRRHIEELGDLYPAQLLLLQVEKKDGIYFRVNAGEIDQAAWEASNPEWRLIALG